jgi:hypothetical protein
VAGLDLGARAGGAREWEGARAGATGEWEIAPAGGAKPDQEQEIFRLGAETEDLTSGARSPLMPSEKPEIAVPLFWLAK